jgi:hypothetical protein
MNHIPMIYDSICVIYRKHILAIYLYVCLCGRLHPPTKRRPRLEVPSAEGDAQLKLRVAFAELLEIWLVNGGEATHEKKQLGGFQSWGIPPNHPGVMAMT